MWNNLFSNFQLGGLDLPNRAVLAPMTRTSAELSGKANEKMARYYARFAKGGIGLVITEGLYPNHVNSRSYNYQPGIADEDQAASWQPVIEAVHREGGKVIAQLMHAGALVQHNDFTAIAPSAVQPVGELLKEHGGSGEFATPREMTKEDIQIAIDSFAQAAVRAKKVGFDGVEVHGANGYLLDQFVTDYTNQRTDEYGGSTENRIRLTVEVLHAIRSAVGPNYIVGVRISQGKVNDFHHKWANGEKDAQTIFEQLAEASPTYIHTTEYKAFAPAFANTQFTLAELAKRYSHLPVIANGKLGDPEKAESLLADGAANMIAIGREALVNPDWVNKIKEGRALNVFCHQSLEPIATLREEEYA
ncbi:NADH:flavin oxidoreductase [Aureibacillus halotolerans]|uniref:2,4-dienoyl-CoA reductase-like NADH-dependent reductase (Old Yellow Enzyme family) n=1 Tax=Aureibacillus halotolerans TaxID=1508390 RepID=A0A4R6UCU5_9BACI|nr:2,4-dienoyl-CoA reductase-like NADH-dependent reductase (Old Yellow Enzyme family) [Aureibacillus halotolerans]